MQAKRMTLTVFGGKVNILLRKTEDGYRCEFDRLRNYGDARQDLITSGSGETEQEAIAAYVRSCHLLEKSAP